MLFKNVAQLRQFGVKLISTNPPKRTAGVVSASSKRDDYYQGLLDLTEQEGKPPGWDEALPFTAIPGPKPLPVIGNLWRYMPYIGEYHGVPLRELYITMRKQFGDIILLRGIPGRKPIVALFNTDDMELLFRNVGPFPIRRGIDSILKYRKETRKDIFKGKIGLMVLQGKDWFDFRSIVNPILMQPRIAAQYVQSMDGVANELLDNIRHFSSKSETNEMPENFLNELYKWSFESVGVIALDRRLGCLNLNTPKDSDVFKLISSVNEMFLLMYKLDILPPFWKIIETPSWKRYVKVMNTITEILIKYIDEAIANPPPADTPEHKLSVLQRLITKDKEVAVSMVMDMLIAGIDTTGKSVGATLYFLAKNPDKQQRLREETLKNLPEKDSPVTKEILSNSPYLKAVIKESVRISPIGIGNSRATIKDMVIRGYQIPKDTDIATLNIITANSDQFKDPESFIPERWLRTTDDDLSYKGAHPFAYLPFGFGPRSCIGKRMANLEIEVAVAKIVRNFQLSWHHEDLKFGGHFLYGIQSPLRLTIKPL